MRRVLLPALVVLAGISPASAGKLIEPHMRIVPAGDAPEVALTLDACSGGTDQRILDVLIAHRIPATIFATRRWMLHNPDTVSLLVDHADLFEIEDHGAEHVPAVVGDAHPYGITPAGTLKAVEAEVEGGADAVVAATSHPVHWYRGATALYTKDALDLIASLGLEVGGFSLNGDLGASASSAKARTLIASAHSGDVIIAHMNQPKRSAGAGVAAGIIDLLDKGVKFVRLDAVAEIAD